MRRVANRGIWQVKNILMLGSSHSACFSSIDFYPDFQLSIAANASNGLFRNLQIDEKGMMSCKDKNRAWNNAVFQNSLNHSSKCIHDYNSIILNISCDFNLPMLFSKDQSDAQSIDAYSLALIKETINSSLEVALADKKRDLKKNKKLIEKLRSLGFKGNIFLLLTPFDTSLNKSQTHKRSQLCASRIEFILAFVSRKFHEIFEIEILLPSSEMVDDCLFVKNIYTAAVESTWKGNARSKTFYKNDTKHKNKQYALDIVRKNIGKIV